MYIIPVVLSCFQHIGKKTNKISYCNNGWIDILNFGPQKSHQELFGDKCFAREHFNMEQELGIDHRPSD